LAIVVEHFFGVICIVRAPDSSTRSADHLHHFEFWPSLQP
jgi:hypothetical protein